MRRGYSTKLPRKTQEHDVNNDIRHKEIRLIGPDGDQLGLMTPAEGMKHAEEHGLDLVEVAPQARPPVCRLINYDKFRYDEAKKKTEAKAKARASRVQEKTIRLRPKIEEHDLQTKLRKAAQCLSGGARVKLLMLMRGREQAHVQLHIQKVNEIATQLQDVGEVIRRPQREGRTLTCILEPISVPA